MATIEKAMSNAGSSALKIHDYDLFPLATGSVGYFVYETAWHKGSRVLPSSSYSNLLPLTTRKPHTFKPSTVTCCSNQTEAKMKFMIFIFTFFALLIGSAVAKGGGGSNGAPKGPKNNGNQNTGDENLDGL